MQHSDVPSGATAGGGVVCEFVRQRCTHDALFQPFYKRSNRTKGSKILRCFPHCCPNHAHRGFCGSSLHVRVEWPSASSAAPPPPPSIHVLGRFRLSDTPPLPLGHCLPAPTVFGAVQSDDTPNGEWIDSQMIYSWSETNWLFEINSAARWFYGWESSTVKSQRLKDHVLDIYVLASSAPSAAAATAADVLRVVAATTSPSFQLISFRRATDDAMLALSATHHVRQQLQSGGGAAADAHQPQPPPHPQLHHQQHHHHLHQHPPSRPLSQEEPPHVHAMGVGGPRAPHIRYHADAPTGQPIHAVSHLPQPAPPASRPLHHHLRAPAAHTSVPVTRPLSLPSLRPPMVSSAASSVSSSGGAVRQWTAPPLATTAPTSRPLTSLAPLHRAPLSLRSFVPQGSHMAPPQTRPHLPRPAAFVAPPTQTPLRDAAPQPAWRPPQLAIARPIAPAASGGGGGRASAAWEVSNLLSLLHQVPLADAFERVASVHETYEQHAAEYAAAVTEEQAKGDDDGDKENSQKHETKPRHVASRPPSVGADAEMSVRRALASLGLHASPRKLPPRLVETLTELALWMLFDQVTIRQLHGAARSATEALSDPALVLRFYGRAVFFLHDHMGRFLERRFQTSIRDVLRECELLGLQMQRESADDACASPHAAVKGGARAMKGQDSFVAQAREMLIATTRSHSHSSAKRRRLASQSTAAALDVRKAAPHSAFDAQWACSLNDVVVTRASSSSPPTDASLFTLLWFYRQFSVVSLALAAATLDVRSLFALSAPLGSSLVLDGAGRFLHAFPAGEATLATTVGRYAFGDYVGERVDATAVRLRLYAFLAPSQLPTDGERDHELPLERVAADACVCYHVTLRAAGDALHAAVAVETGALDLAALRRAGHGDGARALLRDMTTWSLRQKLAAVRSFTPTAQAELVYRRQEPSTA